MSEDEIAEIMDSVETDEEADEDDYDSDDSIKYPDFDPQIHQISPENEGQSMNTLQMYFINIYIV